MTTPLDMPKKRPAPAPHRSKSYCSPDRHIIRFVSLRTCEALMAHRHENASVHVRYGRAARLHHANPGRIWTGFLVQEEPGRQTVHVVTENAEVYVFGLHGEFVTFFNLGTSRIFMYQQFTEVPVNIISAAIDKEMGL